MLGNDHFEIQAAFAGLLANPIVMPWRHPELHVLVYRHATVLDVWAKQVNYLLAGTNRCYRLHRPPVEGGVTPPVTTPPPHGQLVLALYTASCLEASPGEPLTLQELSDDVVRLAQVNGGWSCDPSRRPGWQRLLVTTQLLIGHEILKKYTSDTLQNDWERAGSGVDTGCLLHRGTLMLLVGANDVDLALARWIDGGQDVRGQELLRILVECQTLYPQELPGSHRDYSTWQCSRLVERAEELTGGRVEARSGAPVLMMSASRELSEGLVCGFPDITTLDQVILAMIDTLCPGATGFRRVPIDRMLAVMEDIYHGRGKQPTVALKESTMAIRDVVIGWLGRLGPLRVEAGDRILAPATGRHRDAELASDEGK